MNAPAAKSGDVSFPVWATSFRRFFDELREAFLEREWLFTQLELALLCREHVLIIGPPGTAKSAIATSVLGRIVDEGTSKPSLFSKQLAENTVQTDLIGPVDFKVLTETGRTEHLTDEGMLGAVHAFLDEVFDGRDMLLRSILNVLHERELKHGRKVTPGRCECAVMTSNRYLSEVVARSPETLQAFADRISFICFTPKSFARRSSRAQMLARAQGSDRVVLSERLTLQQLDGLQDMVARVEVPPMVAEGLEQLADTLERELLAQVVKLPDYVPTKYFSQRSMVKALWALKAIVVRDRIYRRPERRLVADLADLELLRYFFLLGGPPPVELDALVKGAADPRERAQLDIIRVENRAFDEALKSLGASLQRAAEREAAELAMKEELASAEAQLRSWSPVVASTVARALREKLVPGPRHPENRGPLLRGAQNLVQAFEARVARGLASPEGRGGVALLGSFLDVFELVRRVPEFDERVAGIAAQVVEACRQAASLVALGAEAAEFEENLRLDAVAGLASSSLEELTKIMELLQTAGAVLPPPAEDVRRELAGVRERTGASLQRRATRTFEAAKTTRRPGDPLEQLAADSRRLRELDQTLSELSPGQSSLRARLLTPLGEAYALDALGSLQFTRLDQLSRGLPAILENLRREGASVEAGAKVMRPVVEERVRKHLGSSQPARAATPEANVVFSGEAYTLYRQALTTNAPDGESQALQALSALLGHHASAPLPQALLDQTAELEIASLIVRVRFLRGWLSHLLAALPAPEELRKGEADQAFDKLVKSRFPLLVTKEGELVRLETSLRRLASERGERAEAVAKLVTLLRSVNDDFMGYAKRLFDARARA